MTKEEQETLIDRVVHKDYFRCLVLAKLERRYRSQGLPWDTPKFLANKPKNPGILPFCTDAHTAGLRTKPSHDLES